MNHAWIAIAVVLGALVGASLALSLARALRRWRTARRFARGRRLEAEAPALLLRKGFQVVDHGRVVSATLLVDGRSNGYEVRLDYLVEDLQGLPWVAEVKSGTDAPDPLQRSTRRQLLEYALLVPDAAGLLLVDMEARTVREIVFPSLARLRSLARPVPPGQGVAVVETEQA